MNEKLYIPAYPLNQFIESFLYYTGFNPLHSVDRFLPDGNVQIVLDLTDNPKYIYDNETLKEIQSCKKVWFSGFRTKPITIPSGKESEMIIVNFHMGKAYPFLNEPLHSLTNYVVNAELVLKNDILNLRESIIDAPTQEQKFILLEKELLKHYCNYLNKNSVVDFTVTKIVTSPNQSSIKTISSSVGYSQKHLIKIFKDHVGVTPKDFLKVIRFQKVIQKIEQHKNINWSTLALDCGFYDQSHFIADFKSFSGYTPTEYLAKKGKLLNYIPIK